VSRRDHRSNVLPAPHERVSARFKVPFGHQSTQFVSRPGAGVAYAGVLPGRAPRSDRAIDVTRAGYSAVWAPQGPTLQRATALYQEAQDRALEMDMLEGELEVPSSEPDYRLLAGIGVGLLVLLLWSK
jgi:hypothetical protein